MDIGIWLRKFQVSNSHFCDYTRSNYTILYKCRFSFVNWIWIHLNFGDTDISNFTTFYRASNTHLFTVNQRKFQYFFHFPSPTINVFFFSNFLTIQCIESIDYNHSLIELKYFCCCKKCINGKNINVYIANQTLFQVINVWKWEEEEKKMGPYTVCTFDEITKETRLIDFEIK